MRFDPLADPAEVGCDTRSNAGPAFDDEAARIERVVTRFLGVNEEISHSETLPVQERSDGELVRGEKCSGVSSRGRVDRNLVFSGDPEGSTDMISMFVSEQDCIELFDLPTDTLQPSGRLTDAETRVDEDGCAVTLEVVCITLTA